VSFASESMLQSAVYENSDVMFRMLGNMGKEELPENLRVKPFHSMEISTVTTSEMLWWTVGLTVTPAIAVLAVAIVVFAKRRRA